MEYLSHNTFNFCIKSVCVILLTSIISNESSFFERLHIQLIFLFTSVRFIEFFSGGPVHLNNLRYGVCPAVVPFLQRSQSCAQCYELRNHQSHFWYVNQSQIQNQSPNVVLKNNLYSKLRSLG